MRRASTTTKVLSIAFALAPVGASAVAGCTKPDVHADPAPSASAKPPDPPKGEIDREKLHALQDELGALSREDALKKVDHFRPLCDDKGYPLVGNLQRKAVDLPPSELCAEIRKQNKI